MARTPLMRALQRLAREHATADAIGVNVQELREREAETAYSRREFIKRGGAVGAAVAVAGPLAFARRARGASSPRIAIVGGGIAGLSCALALQDKGVASTVYEASDRIGGRMHSDRSGYWAAGQVSEFCGELIDTGHKTIRQLAKRFGLPTVDLLAAQPNGSEDTYFFFGSYYSPAQVSDDFRPVHRALKEDVQAAGYPTTYQSSTAAGVALDNMSVYDWIESRVPGGHGSSFGMLLDVAYNEEYGAETTVQSALNLVYLLGFSSTPANFSVFGASDERFHIVGGNEQLPEAIAGTLSDVRTGWRLTAVKRNASGTITLTFDTGDAHSRDVVADHAVLAIPFSILRTLDTRRADFDGLKQTAIKKLGDGRNSKLQLQFDSRYWNTTGPWGLSTGSVFSDLGFQNTWDVTRGQPGKQGILVDYTGGNIAGSFKPSMPYSNADSNPQVAAYAQDVLENFNVVFPGIKRRWNGKATLSTSFRDPNLLLSYSYWKVGQYHTFSGYEGVRQGNIHFAGEHCSQDFQGFMEGGASEGARAAAEILGDLK